MPEQDLLDKRQRDEDVSAAGSAAKKQRFDGANQPQGQPGHGAVKVESGWVGPDVVKAGAPIPSSAPLPMKQDLATPKQAVNPALQPNPQHLPSAWSSPEMQALRLKAAGTLPLQHQHHQHQHPKPMPAYSQPQHPKPSQPPPPGWSAGPGMWGPVTPLPLHAAAARQYSARELALQDVDLEHWRTEPVVIPSYASWFELGAVHDLERRALPDILARGDPEEERAYVAARDRMVRLYRDYPHKVLTASDCLAHVAARADVVVRTHALLEYWGLVNAEADGRVRLGKALEQVKVADRRSVKRCAVTGQRLERVYFYHRDTEKHPTCLLSPNAYSAGLLPPTMCPHDFKRKAATDAMTPNMPSFDDWTEDETARLLDAVIKCGENWDVVAQYVGGKSMEQCVLQFARLPIADPYIQHPIPDSGTPTPPGLPDRLGPRDSLRHAFPLKWAPPWRDTLAEMLFMFASSPGALAAADAASSIVAADAPSLSRAWSGEEDGGHGGVGQRVAAIAERAPWVHALQWPPQSPTQRPSVGSYIVLLSEEAGRFRGRVTALRRPKAGVMDVELCGGRVCTLQLREGECRVVGAKEVAAVEEALGCGFLELAAAERKEEEQRGGEGREAGPLDAVGVREERELSALSAKAAVWRRARARMHEKGEGGDALEAVECAVAAVGLRVGAYERREEEMREMRWRAEAARRRETEDACRRLAQSPAKRAQSARPPRRRAMLNALGELLEGDGRASPMLDDAGDEGS